jgi:hypothetical protein
MSPTASIAPHREQTAARIGGGSLVAAAILFVAAFSVLAATFDYPAILDRPASEVLPRLIALGTTGRAVWSIYAMIPLLLVPAGVGAALALRAVAPAAARCGAVFAAVSGFSMMLGLARWPSVHWVIGERYRAASPSDRVALEAIYSGLNAYLGNFVGEFVGELALNLFFALTAYALLRRGGRSRWLGVAGCAASAIGFVAMFRNAAPAVGPIADLNNVVLPLWLVVFGVALAREREPGRVAAGAVAA